MKEEQKKRSHIARVLRNNMTKEERKLWYDFLKKLPLTVNRQKVIVKYVVDFYCSEKKTVIELDGSQHYESKGMTNDSERDAFMNSNGITVLRYSNQSINNDFENVCNDILDKFGMENIML